jgi:hypothetical protein
VNPARSPVAPSTTSARGDLAPEGESSNQLREAAHATHPRAVPASLLSSGGEGGAVNSAGGANVA